MAVLLTPIDDCPDSVLGIRRSIEPHKGGIALPAGYLETKEVWRVGAARELFEETGVVVPPDSIQVFDVESSPTNPNVLLVFCVTPSIPRIPEDFVPNAEVSELLPLYLRTETAFDIHTKMMRRFLTTDRILKFPT